MEASDNYILGLDIGSNSIGWAIIATEKKKPAKIVQTGVRVFEAGMEGDIEKGREESRNKARREARHIRRQLWRHARRLKKLLHILQREKLLPEGYAAKVFEGKEGLDQKFLENYSKNLSENEKHKLAQVLPYYLRKRALDEKLELYELGRALYHLAQRRGFKSGRKAPKEKEGEEEKSKVKKEISDLAKEMDEKGARTLGEYFTNLDPTDPNKRRIRERWTSRKMYEDEFEKIWKAQKKHHPNTLTDELKKEVWKTIFFQRPLKPVQDTIGDCQFEKGKKRAPWALPSAQRFRYLQKLNDLRIISPKKTKDEAREPRLTDEERKNVIYELERNEEISFQRIRDILGLKRNYKFNFVKEESGETEEVESKTTFPGNATSAQLLNVFGEERWSQLSDPERDQIVEEILKLREKIASHYWEHSNEKDVIETMPKIEDELKQLCTRWKSDEAKAHELAKIELEDGYCNLSREALTRVLPEMEKGKSYATVVKDIYQKDLAEEQESAVSMAELLGKLRNPVVARALSQLHKLVKAIIKEHGVPEKIRVELLREMKKNRIQRENVSHINELNRTQREGKGKILKEMGLKPTKDNINKLLLAEECKERCPYCGKKVESRNHLFNGAFEIDHIIPYHRSYDDSFLNKTLICEKCNNKKLDQTPYEWKGTTPEWGDILDRVEHFKSTTISFTSRVKNREGKKVEVRLAAVREKLKRFKLHDEELKKFLEGFSNAQFNNSAWASRKARELITCSIGKEREKKIESLAGGVTAQMRNELQLNSILADGVKKDEVKEKKRIDHRHHAVDAVAIALTEPKTVEMLSNAYKQSKKEKKKKKWQFWQDFVKKVAWDNFLHQVKCSIYETVASHQVSRKIPGKLHEETYYGKVNEIDEKKNIRELFRVRRRLGTGRGCLKKTEVQDIADKNVKRAVIEKMHQLGTDDPGQAFANPQNHPYLKDKRGNPKSIIHKVRIDVKKKPEKKLKAGWVKTEDNHHAEVWEKGDGTYDGNVLSTFDAMDRTRRKKRGENSSHIQIPAGTKLVFSIHKYDTVAIKDTDGQPGYYVVKSIAAGPDILLVHVNDARKLTEVQKPGVRLSFKIWKRLREKRESVPVRAPFRVWRVTNWDFLRQMNCQKLDILPLGDEKRRND
jgi:CRISPR-associated endonuclease Csn1